MLNMRYTILSLLLLSACTSPEIEKSHPSLPHLTGQTVAVYAFSNYTQTPLAGKRAASIAEGILSSKGIQTRYSVEKPYTNFSQMCHDAKQHHTPYLLTGAVHEWRYKTGIDGEPAVSFSLKLLRTDTCSAVWSATAADNDWGNASIGTTAQKLMNQTLQ